MKIGSSLHLPSVADDNREQDERREYNKSVTETHAQYTRISIVVRTLIVVIPQSPTSVSGLNGTNVNANLILSTNPRV